jgi:hypothetical protein
VPKEGDWQSATSLKFLGGALVWYSDDSPTVPRMNGTETAVKSGILVAEAPFCPLRQPEARDSEATSV